MRFFSCFSGIEAASVALTPLGFECVGVAEVDKAASRVLAFRYPETPNLGDVMADDFIDRVKALSPDILVGGPPCQDFSIAGLRAGLAGNRGNLTLRWVEIIRAVGPIAALTENVPGWLSVNDGHAFGAFLGALVGSDAALIPPQECGGRWTDAGMVDGPEGRAAWRTLDAQFFGLAQRRKRVFVVFCPRDGADPAEILFERKSVGRNSPPRREKGQGASGTAQAGAGVGGEQAPLTARMVAFGEYECDGTAPTLKMRDYKDATDLVAQPVANVLGAKKDGGWRGDLDNDTYVAHSLRGEGFDASEDGTGRGTPIVPVALRGHSDYGDGLPSLRAKGGDCGGGSEALIAAYRTSGNFGAWDTGDRVDALMTGTDPNSHVVAFAQNTRDEVRIFGEDGSTVGALSAEPGMKQQCYVAQAFDLRGRDGGAHFEGPHDTANIRAASGGSSRSYVAQQWAVRRLTPRECERLQGFPDDWTLTPDAKGKSQADGPRYKQLGNSWAVPVVRWIGERLASESRA